MQVIAQLMARSEEAAQQARELADESETLQVRHSALEPAGPAQRPHPASDLPWDLSCAHFTLEGREVTTCDELDMQSPCLIFNRLQFSSGSA